MRIKPHRLFRKDERLDEPFCELNGRYVREDRRKYNPTRRVPPGLPVLPQLPMLHT